MGFARVGVRQYYEGEHLWNARLGAHLCRLREDELVASGSYGVVDYPLRAFAVMAIQEAVAFMEARVNTIWQNAADREEGNEAGDPLLDGLTVETIVLLRELWKHGRVKSLPMLDKFDAALRTARKPGIDKSHGSLFQDVQPLTWLRNGLVHFTPETEWFDEPHRLRDALSHRVPGNPLMAGVQPWFPHQPLCAGVAEWAWQTCVAFVQDWDALMGLTDMYLERMEEAVPWPDGENDR